MTNTAEILKKFKMNKEFVDSGFISQENLLRLAQEFEKSDDKNTEHYRYGIFLSFLNERKILTDAEITRYLRLCDLDEDQIMADAARNDLLLFSGLTEIQRKRVTSESQL